MPAGVAFGLTIAIPVFKPVAGSALMTTSVKVTRGLPKTLAWERVPPTCCPKVSDTLRPFPVPDTGVTTANPVRSVPVFAVFWLNAIWLEE